MSEIMCVMTVSSKSNLDKFRFRVSNISGCL